MKKMFTLAVLMTIAIAANAMTYTEARTEALFLSDKMAYELDLSPAQYDAVYEINLDYLLSVGSHADLFGTHWTRRNTDLRYVLTSWQYSRYMAADYFYRPLAWMGGSWNFSIYSHYGRNLMFNARPTVFVSYRGGNNRHAHSSYANRNFGKPAAPTAHRTGTMVRTGTNPGHTSSSTRVTVNVTNRNVNVNHNGNHNVNGHAGNIHSHTANNSPMGNKNIGHTGTGINRSANTNGHFGGSATRTGNAPTRSGVNRN